MTQTHLVLFTTLVLAGYGTSSVAQQSDGVPGADLRPQIQATPSVPDSNSDRSYAQLRGLDNASGVQPQPGAEVNPGYAQPLPGAENPAAATPLPKQHSKKHSAAGETTRLPGDAAKVGVGMTDRTAKTGVGMADRTAKTGLGLTDRAVKTTVGAPLKGVKEVFKAIF